MIVPVPEFGSIANSGDLKVVVDTAPSLADKFSCADATDENSLIKDKTHQKGEPKW